MNDLFYLSHNNNIKTELNQIYHLRQQEDEIQAVLLPVKDGGAGQRRLRTETVSGPLIRITSDNLVDALAKYENNPEGIPPLLYATKMGDFEVVKLLIEHGADVNQIHLKDCALRLALRHPPILQLLIDSGADLNIKLAQRKTPLHFAVADESTFESLCILLENGADVNAVDLYGKTPLHHHCRANSKITLALLENGANIHIADDKGWKPLHLAYQECSINLLKEFMKRGGSLNEFTPPGLLGGVNALHCAILYGKYYGHARTDCLTLVKWLIDEQKMNVNEFSRWDEGKGRGPTPIMFALAKKPEDDFELLDYLINRGADLNVQCYMNGCQRPVWTGVLDWGKNQAQLPRHIMEWLIQHGAR